MGGIESELNNYSNFVFRNQPEQIETIRLNE